MINNRQQQAGRRRGRGGNNGGNGGGGGAPRQGGQGRSDNGNRIDSRSRGNANQLYEKYKNLASDAQRQGDRVNTEYYLQFADHYFRVLSDQRGRVEEQQPRRQQPDFDIDGNDDDYGDEGEPIRAGEQQGGPDTRGDRPDRDRPDRQYREPQDRGDRPMQDRQAQDWQGQPQERAEQRQDRPERQRDARRPDGERLERPRRWDRDDRPRQMEGETEVAGQHRADPIVPGEDLEARAEAVIEADAPLQAEPAPRRRGRPRREPLALDQSVDRDGEPAADEATPPLGNENGVDADRLPPSLGATLGTAANDGADEAPKPRRRRVRAAATGDASAS